MKHAEKLNLNIDVSDLNLHKCTPHKKYTKFQKYSKHLPGINLGSETKYVENEYLYIQQLPKSLLSIEVPKVFLLEILKPSSDNSLLPIHIDINKTCGINVYLEANNEVTKFYDWDTTTRTCSYVEEFCAEPGDVWLMNNKQPHSVDLVKDCQRRILTYSFVSTPYNVVLETINANNNYKKQ